MLSKFGAALRHLEPVRQVLFHRPELYVRKRFRGRRRQFYDKFWHDVCRAGGWECEDVGSGCYRIRTRDRFTYTAGYYAQIDSPAVLSVAGDKVLSRKLLEEIDVPVPRQLSFAISGLSLAHEFLREVGGKVVVKPVEGGGGAGVTTDIVDNYGLGSAAVKASAVSSNILVEEQIEGANYRLLYLNGVLIDAIRRDSPSVIGDGSSHVSRLINMENEFRLEQDPITALSPLVEDAAVKNYFKVKGLSTRYVPANGEKLEVKSSINQNCARDNHRVNEIVHPSYRDLGRRILNQIDIKLLGIDVITPNIEEPLEATRGAVNEINGTPAFHHHELVSGQLDLSPVGPQVLDYILGTGIAPQS